MQAGADHDPLERALAREPLADRAQHRHLPVGPFDPRLAGGGERAVGDVRAGHHDDRAAASALRQRAGQAVDVRLGGGPVRHRHASGGAAVPDRPAEPCLAPALDLLDHRARGRVVVVEAQEHLVEDHVVEHLRAVERLHRLAQAPRVVAAALDQLGEPLAAERAQRRVDRHGASAAGHLGHVVERLAAALVREVAGAHAHGGAHRRAVGHDRQRAVVGHVQPLVRVDRPGVGALGPARQVAKPRARSRPQPERAVDVQPRAVLVRGVGDVGEWIERAGVHLTRLCTDDRRAVAQRRRERVGAHRSLIVGRDPDRPPRAQAGVAQRDEERRVDLIADQDLDRRRSREPVGLDIPAGPREHGVAGGGEPGEVGHRRPGREPDGRAGGQPERLQHPALGDRLDRRRRGRARAREPVLVPGGGQPVGRQRGGQRAAGDEPEVARPGAGDGRRPGGGDQPLDHLDRVRALLGQRLVERRHRVLVGDGGAHAALTDPREVLLGELGSAAQRAHRAWSASIPTATASTRRRSSVLSGSPDMSMS